MGEERLLCMTEAQTSSCADCVTGDGSHSKGLHYSWSPNPANPAYPPGNWSALIWMDRDRRTMPLTAWLPAWLARRERRPWDRRWGRGQVGETRLSMKSITWPSPETHTMPAIRSCLCQQHFTLSVLNHYQFQHGNCPSWELYLGNWPTWELSQMGAVPHGNCPRWELSHMGTVPGGSRPRWELSQLGAVPGELSQVGAVPHGNCPNWELF